MNPIQKITKEEFIRQYTENSSVTMEELREWGKEVYPCDCDYEECQGWRMVNMKTYEIEQRLNESNTKTR